MINVINITIIKFFLEYSLTCQDIQDEKSASKKGPTKIEELL